MGSEFARLAFWPWVAFFVVWAPGYFTAKTTRRVPAPALQLPVSALLIVAFAFLSVPRLFRLGLQITPHVWILGAVGLALDCVGVAFAIWARLTIGRNWSGIVMTVKEDHELVQSGPYGLVRHPIYAGILLALIGVALIRGTAGSYLGAAAGLVAFVLRVEFEDRLMRAQFGAAHEAYSARTKKLVPFVW